MLKAVTLLGSSSGRNAGDAALISGIQAAVDQACGTQLIYEVPTIRPEYIRASYDSQIRPVSMLPWNFSVKMLGIPTYQSVMRTDLSLIFDAILFDRALYNPLFNFLSTLYLLLPRAKRKGRKLAFYNVGTGPVDTRAGREMLKKLADIMDFMTVRDQDSIDILTGLGVPKERIVLGADAALNVKACPEERVRRVYGELGLNPAEEILGINVNTYIDTWSRPRRPSMGRKKFVESYTAALNTVVEKIRVPLLFVCTQHDDVSLTKEIQSRIAPIVPMALISNREYNHHDIKGVLSKLALLVGMRLHAMILASSAQTPIAGLAYQPKNEYYFKCVGLQDYLLRFTDYSEAALTDLMLKGWHDRQRLRMQLESCIPRLQKEAFKGAELAAALHRDEDPAVLIARYQQEAAGQASSTLLD